RNTRGRVCSPTFELLPGDDGRWRSFGLNPPNVAGLPEVPEGVTVLPGIAGHLMVTFESAALAACQAAANCATRRSIIRFFTPRVASLFCGPQPKKNLWQK